MYLIYQNYKIEARHHASTIEDPDSRLHCARSFCKVAVQSYWNATSRMYGGQITIKECPIPLIPISSNLDQLASKLGALVTNFPPEDAGFLIGSVYTAMLPNSLRSKHGAYYTPPPLIERLLTLAENSGVDFKTAKIIDPACGGGAFLAPLALKIVENTSELNSETIINAVNSRIRGIELDPFAAWISHVLLEAVILPHCINSGLRLNEIIHVGDALEVQHRPEYDLVIGNPPYGKITLPPFLRNKYSRSIFGHANLYSLFIDLSLQLLNHSGVAALITPTSFLSGQYFKNLRGMLSQEVTASHFEFVKDRHGVFEDVQQETILTTFKNRNQPTELRISELLPEGLNTFKVGEIGRGQIEPGDAPWFLPREPSDVDFIVRMMKNTNRLKDLGFHTSTGPLVWNQHKKSLNHERQGLPLIWSHHVTPSGFDYTLNDFGHGDHVRFTSEKNHLVTSNECILVKRTTSKEQARRILAAVLPSSFIDNTGGVCIENHLNIISYADKQTIKLELLSAILNSRVIDKIFRCINGSTAVSAYELNALPFPCTSRLQEIERLISIGTSGEILEKAIEESYGL